MLGECVILIRRAGIKALLLAGLLVACLPAGWGHALSNSEQAWLAAEGYRPGSHALLLVWQEVDPGDPSRQLTGYRLEAHDSGTPVSLYRDESFARVAPPHGRRDWSGAPVERAADLRPGLPYLQPEAPQPRTARLTSRQAQVVLRPDVAAAMLEDEAPSGIGKGTYRYGLRTPWQTPVTLGATGGPATGWTMLDDGTAVWQLDIIAEGALGQRLHLEEFALPAGGSALVYNPGDPGERFQLPRVAEDYWTPTIFGPAVTLEIAVPATRIGDVWLRLGESAYQYRDLAPALAAAAGACNLDVTCYEDWRNAALGVGGLGLVGRDGQLFCTGSLIADDNPQDGIDHLLGADHCLGGRNSPGSLEVYWLYQSDSCDGAVPNPRSVPRTTGGADRLVSSPASNGTDVALMRLRQPAPAGIVALGFSTTAASVGEPVACIHHPSGDFKRIAFGSITDRGQRLKPITRYHETTWVDSTTEPGSSGSPLFRSDTQQIIGQLYGGRASCFRINEPDYYGRFDQSWPLLQPFLQPGPPDPFDLDGSNTVDSADLQIVVNAALAEQPLAVADLDKNASVDVTDVQLMVNAVLDPFKASPLGPAR